MPDLSESLDLGEELAWTPTRLVPPAPWAGHIPFAFWLVKALRPRRFVELGAGSGNAYFAVCQAMAAFCPGGRAYAVDAWEAGREGEESFEAVSRFSRQHHLARSTLLRTTPEQARGSFAEGSLDLLLLDGLRGDAAVRAEFEAWRGALGRRGVVLVHGVEAGEGGLGAWRFWEEASRDHPAFAFRHAHGLGVLGAGGEQAPALRALLGLPPEQADSLRLRFASRGEALERAAEAQLLRERLAAAERALAEAGAEAERARAERRVLGEALRAREALAESRGELAGARQRLAEEMGEVAAARAAALDRRDALLRERDALVERLTQDLRAERERLRDGFLAERERLGQDLRAEQERLGHDLRAERERLVAAWSQAERAREAAERDAEAARRETSRVAEQYVGSTSWRVTRPLRVAARLMRGQPLRLLPAPALPPPAHEALPVLDAPPTIEAPFPAEAAPEPEAPPAPAGLVSVKAAMRSTLQARLRAFLSGGATLRLPRAEQPEVSIVLVLYDQAELTYGCLASVAETLGPDAPPAEVIVLDNGSTDETGALLERLEGATVIRSPVNLHFLRGVNRAARSARGRTLLLLNNDAQLLPGTVASALSTLDSAPDIGAVGGRIVLPDGTLQEAGSVVWRDGACAGYGRGDDPEAPEYMFRRDVDYCSGALLLLPAALWREMGGFDQRFAPAYYEETDLCLRIWRSGRRVVYDPAAVILHHEFGSASSTSQALALQAANHATFAERHRGWLAGQFPASPLNLLAARSARRQAPRVLVVDDRVPKPELGTGYPRANRLLHELVEAGAEVTLFPCFRHAETWAGVRRALDPRIEVMLWAEASQLRPFLESRRGHYDAILVCRPHNMRAFEEAIGTDRGLIGEARVLYDAEALFATRDLQRREAAGDPVGPEERRRLLADEVALTRLADGVLSVSDRERETLEAYGARRVELLGHALDEEPIPVGFEERRGFVFLGAVQSDDAPNAEALRWFVEQALPALRRERGEATRLEVVGLVEAPSIRALDGGPLALRGMVDDLREALSGARVMVVPSRLGAGIPHKAHQAAALGLPMVATPLIAAQLGWEDGVELLVAEDALSFARACARLHDDRALWEGVRQRALARVRRDCAPEAFRARIRALLAETPRTARRPQPVPALAAPPLRPARFETAREPSSDHAAVVPFAYLPPPPDPAPSVGVVCHLYHPEVGVELLPYLANLPVPADLHLSTDTAAKADRLRETFAGWGGGAVEVRVTPNRGRDIAPKLVGFAGAHERHDLVLHLHSKRSDHAPSLAPWRGFLFESVLGSREVVSSILDAFARLPDLGMVAPQHYEPVRRWLGWNGNFDEARELATRMGITLSPTRALDFPSGSMFWARSAALRPLLDLKLSFEDFPEEGAQLDHTLAHVIERLYFHVCERSGHAWMKVAQPVLYHRTGTMEEIPAPGALSRYAAERLVLLGGRARLPTRTAPEPAVRAPPGLLARLARRKA